MITLAQETTTLAEGPTITVMRQQLKTGCIGTYLHAAAVNTPEMKMRVDDVAPSSLRQYLDLMVRAIRRDMAQITQRPTISFKSPTTIHNFVHNMAQAGMFVSTIISDVDTTRNQGIPTTGRKVSRHKRRTGNKSHTG